MNLEEYRRKFSEDDTPGWDAIAERLEQLYPGITPAHWAPSVPYALGGSQPLDGISSYRSMSGGIAHRHFVTFGFSSLYYNEAHLGAEFSNFGFELSFRLAETDIGTDEPWWVGNLLQNLARYVFQSKRWFERLNYIPANGPIRADSNTLVTALVTERDPELGALDTPHGRVDFIQMLGITQREYEALLEGRIACTDFMRAESASNPLYITRLDRGR